jgi:inosine-uridine nucleoside N-ribohydrolase
MVSWETTVAHVFNAEQVDTLMSVDSPQGEFFRRITEKKIQFGLEYFGRKELAQADGLAVAAALEPEIVLKSESHHVQVELHRRMDWRLRRHWNLRSSLNLNHTTSRSSWPENTPVGRPWWIGATDQGTNRTQNWC